MESFALNARKFPGSLTSLADIRHYISQVAQHAGLDKHTVYKLCLAVDEIVTNIVVHGYGASRASGEIFISIQVTDSSLAVVVEDEGPPFDPYAFKLPSNKDLRKPLDSRQPGGLGVLLALESVDKLLYERIGNRNKNIFVVNRQAEKS